MDDQVVVVGAGPAGSALALRLARAGVVVRLLDHAGFPRSKVCGEYLSPGAVGELDALGLGVPVARLGTPVHGIRLYAARGEPLTLAFDGAAALALERRTLDALLLAQARAAGAACERARVEGVIVERGRAVGVRARGAAGELREVRAGVIVGADGAGSVVARRLGLAARPSGPRERFALGGHVAGTGAEGWLSMFSGGGAYFAVNPLGQGRANTMLVLARREIASWGRDVDAGARRRISSLVGGRAALEVFPVPGERMAVGPLSTRVHCVHAPGALLIGDAAGLLNPFTGQGVWLALESARDAAEAVLAALSGASPEPAAWRAYERARRRSWLPRRALSALVELLQARDATAVRAVSRARRRHSAAQTLLGACSGTIPASRGLHPLLLGALLT